MKYYLKSGNKGVIPVHIESVSPTGKYFVGWHTESRSTIYLYKTLYEDSGNIYGEQIMGCSGSSDVLTGFGKVIWYEEYGFVKVIFRVWCSFESESKRLYFDRELYEKMKKLNLNLEK